MTVVALAVLWAVAVSAFQAVFSDADWVVPVAAAVVGALAIERAVVTARDHGVNGVVARLVANLAHLFGLFVVIGFSMYPETMLLIVPTPATVSAWVGGITRAGDLVNQSVPPLPSAPFLGLTIPAVWWCAAASAAGMWTSGASALAVAPPVTIFVAAAFISRGRVGLVWFGALFIAAAIAVIAADTERAKGSARNILGPAAFAAVALVLGAALAPALPGYGQPALFDPRNQVGTTIPDNPFVDIRPRVVDLAETVVFKVGNVPRSYWRLTALAAFNGQQWTAAGPDAPELPMPERGQRLQPEVLIENLDAKWLPVPAYPRNPPEGSEVDRVNNSVVVDGRTRNNTRYFAQSLATDPSAAELEAVKIPTSDTDLRYYLQVPPGVSPRVKGWVRETTAGARNSFDAAVQIQDRLRNTFTYDTQVPPGHTSADLDRFLFETRRGYCEQFASAMAVAARLSGIPSRVAIGYLSEEQNRTTDENGASMWVVKGNDAHAWPELYFPGYGWLAFEPTPSRAVPQANYLGGAGNGEQPTTTTAPQQSTSTTAPQVAPQTTAPQQAGAGATPPEQESSVWAWVPTVVAVLLVLAVVVGAVPVAKLARRRRRRDEGAEGAWAEVVDLLADLGVPVRPSETPREVAARVAAEGVAVGELAELVTLVRYTPPDEPVPLAPVRAAARPDAGGVAAAGAADAFGPGTAASLAWRLLAEAEAALAAKDRARDLRRRWALASLVRSRQERSDGAGAPRPAAVRRERPQSAAAASDADRSAGTKRRPSRISR